MNVERGGKMPQKVVIIADSIGVLSDYPAFTTKASSFHCSLQSYSSVNVFYDHL